MSEARKCEHCGARFAPPTSKNRFCSVRCQRLAYYRRCAGPIEARACEQCGTSFTPPHGHSKFCSVRCRQMATYANQGVAEPRRRRCETCGAQFTSRRKLRFCSPKCRPPDAGKPHTRKPCSVADCSDPAFGRGLCARHYQQARRAGALQPPAPRACRHCGTRFTPQHVSAQFCSARCRLTASRQALRAVQGPRRC
jgi:endogenous inhibitor of DNA gyrase (YacG/DUF329 family)